MSQQVINIGAAPNDGTGDPLRTAFSKANANFTELYNAGFTTGDAKLTFKTVADPTWILLDDGSIGNAASNATTRNNADTVALFTLLYNNIGALVVQDNTGTPVARGANAAADYAANRRLVLPKELGRAIAVAGAGSGLTARVLGAADGSETHSQSPGEVGTHAHGPGASANFTNTDGSIQNYADGGGGGISAYSTTSATPTTANAGAGSPMNVMNPRSYWNVMLKL